MGLFDVGSEEGGFYFVSELAPGETLELLLLDGPPTIKKLLDIATQIADAMAAAHAAGITHRDLKPANIMVTPEGRVKILDFGPARQAKPLKTDETISLHQTTPGMIVGAVSYMSPEQARGREVDYRSDQFSFGLILYEMASGKRPFNRPETVQILSAILTEDPPPLDPKLPPPLRWAIERCLAKEPGDRYESTRDLFRDLRYLRDHLAEAMTLSSGVMPAIAAPIAAPAPRASRFPWRVLAAFASGVLLTAAFIAWRSGNGGADQSAYHFTPFSFEPGGQCCSYWAPDGKPVAYSANNGSGVYQFYLRRLDAPTPVELTHENASSIVKGWSGDGRHILYQRMASKPLEIWSLASVGGEPESAYTLAKGGRSVSCSPAANACAILRLGDDQRYGVSISSPPGAPLKKYSPDPFAAKVVYNNPQLRFSPDGKQILLLINGDADREEAWLLSYPAKASHAPQRVLETLPSLSTPQFDWIPDNRHVVLSVERGVGAAQLWMADTHSDERYALTSGTESRVQPEVSPMDRRFSTWDRPPNAM